MKKEIFGLTPEELQQEFVAAGLKKFRASQVYQWFYKKCVFKFEEMHNLSKADIAVLNEKFTVMPANINILTRWKSSDGLTEKLLLELQDGNSVETVLMHHDYGYSVCVSSQVGCAMACAFCASGLNGCVRNLMSAEIIMQVYLFNAMIAPQQVSRVVVMGSGEPMLNYNEVTGALKFLHREDTAFMSYRNMTVSTCGIIPGIERLAEENIPINLAVSLHAVKDAKGGRAVAVLADMLELGALSVQAHKEVGEMAAAEGVDVLITYGTEAVHTGRAAQEKGVKTFICHDRAEAAKILSGILRNDDIILLKGSHSMQVDGLIDLVLKK